MACYRYVAVVMSVCMMALSSSAQINNLRVPPGALVEVEVEFLNQRGSPGAMMLPVSMVPATSAMPGSSIQSLLSTMTQTALNLRRYYNINSPLPGMEEPCPCDVECCSLPMEPRRIIPVMNLPMTSHPGCCGCVDCPVSLFPLVASMLQSSSRMSLAQQQNMPAQMETKR